MPAMVVIFSCHILRFSMSLKYNASTEKSPQPGHHVGWSAAISFFVRPMRSSVAGGGVATAARLLARTGVSVKVSLMLIIRLFGVGLVQSHSFRNPADTVVLARSRISFTFHVRPSVLLMPWIFGSQ